MTISAFSRRRLQETIGLGLHHKFMPTVVRIECGSCKNGPTLRQWCLVTNRGVTTFLMEDSDNDVRRLGPNRILLVEFTI